MNAVEIIEKKRDGKALTEAEIQFFVQGYTSGDIPDYQAAAWAMAVYLKGMTRDEITAYTMSLAHSGDTLDLHSVLDFAVDKHSSGGVGDKTSLIVLPLVRAFGVPVAKMSGRGLSFTGGTLDKLESIDGYRVDLTEEQFLKQIKDIGIALAGQTRELAPADGKFYALRDVTGTVPSIPLIAGSIMSKKIASGADAIVLDVKVGTGAFMRTVEEARELAQLMVDIGTDVGRRVTALLSDMNQPLGKAVGNAVEVREAIETLQGRGPEDLVEHCVVVAGHMLRLAGKSQADDLSDIRPELRAKLENGEAFEVFKMLIDAQGGDVSQVENPDTLPTAPVIREVPAPQSGYLRAIDALEIGLTAADLGAGRKKKSDPVDHAVGLIVHHNVGERVEPGEPLLTIHARTEEAAQRAAERALAAHEWSDEPVDALPLFYDVITAE